MRKATLEVGRCYAVSGVTEVGVLKVREGSVTLALAGHFSITRLPGAIRECRPKRKRLTKRPKPA